MTTSAPQEIPRAGVEGQSRAPLRLFSSSGAGGREGALSRLVGARTPRRKSSAMATVSSCCSPQPVPPFPRAHVGQTSSQHPLGKWDLPRLVSWLERHRTNTSSNAWENHTFKDSGV